MILVGIDVSKDKHDCFIMNSDGEVLFDSFAILNNLDGFENLYQKILSVENDFSKIKVGLEATGHYSYNLLGFLLDKGFPTYVINPLLSNLYRKSLSLRQTKTDKIDSRMIAYMLVSDVDIQPYSATSYHNEELKSLTRYRFTKVQERAKLKVSIARLVNILFPELEDIFSSIHLATVYALLQEFPGASHIASAHLTKLSNLLKAASKGHFGKSTAIELKNAAKHSIALSIPAKSLEIRHTIRLIDELNSEIAEIESEIQKIMDELNSSILTIPGIGYDMGAMILAEIGDLSKFDSPDKILAYAGLSPTTYQSGYFDSSHSKMEKRGSKYLRYALFNATKYVCMWDPVFKEYLAKKRAEGKHYYVALSHAAKKLVRLIYALEKSHMPYTPKEI